MERKIKLKIMLRYVFLAFSLTYLWVHVLARLKGFQKLTSIEEASRKFYEALMFSKAEVTVINVSSALGRILAKNVTADSDIPRFNRSAVDGYAVKAEETTGATQFRSKALQLIVSDRTIAGKAKQVWTGSRLPEGFDAVVMLEDTKLSENKIYILSQLTPGENVFKKGEDVHKGEIVAHAGTRLKPQHLGLITALGKNKIKVFGKSKIGVLSTGNEIAELGHRLQGNQIFDVNKVVVCALCNEIGAETIDLGIANDDVNEISKKVKFGLSRSDAVITSGGSSVGGPDLVPEAVNEFAKPGVVVHGVAMRPAMPTALAVADGKPILILPGNPVAAMIGFEVFGRPLICRLLGMKHTEPRPVIEARMTRGIATSLGRRSFVRVRVHGQDGEMIAEPVSAKGSGQISTLTKSNGYVVVPENREGVAEGELVSVQLFNYVGA